MNTEELPSDSDQSDDDYIPSDEEGKLSEEESDENISDDPDHHDDGGEKTGKKRRKQQRKSKKVKKVSEKEDNTEIIEETKGNQLSAEDEKKRADSLWADFMKDVGGVCKKPETSSSSTSNDNRNINAKSSKEETKPGEKPEEKKDVGKENTVKVTEIFQFAGEEVRVEKEVAPDPPAVGKARSAKPPIPKTGRGGGLSSVLSQLGKKPKLSVLEKSKLDWSEFKKEEGIEEEIQIHNKGKEGYLERQDFLQRADLRQFEIEKQLRTTKRNCL